MEKQVEAGNRAMGQSRRGMGKPARRKRPGLASLILSGLVLTLGLQGCASLRNPQAVLTELGPQETLPLAWRISGGAGASLYVVGGIHLGPKGGWAYPPGLLAALDSSTAVVVEVNVHEMSADTIQRMVGHYGHLPPGLTLRRSLSPDTWALLEKRIRESSIPLPAANRMQPWLLSNLLIMEAIRRQNYFGDKGTEEAFIRLAGSRSVIALESATQQISFLGMLPRNTQELYLIDTLKHYDQTGHYLDLYINAWRSGDEKALERLTFENYADEAFAPFFDTIIFDRSEKMSKQLKVLLDANQHTGESVFVVVGVAHMVGNRGIGAILEAQGYEVRRISRSELRENPAPGEAIAIHP